MSDLTPLKVGDKAPVFRLRDQHNDWFFLGDLLGKKVLVVYFYPKDNTPVCTKEACQFRDSHEAFKDAGAEVIGISTDGVKSHKYFGTRHKIPFTLLSDPKKEAIKAFGVPSKLFGLLTGRVTYVIDKDGVVRHITDSIRDAKKHVNEALEVVKSLVADGSEVTSAE